MLSRLQIPQVRIFAVAARRQERTIGRDIERCDAAVMGRSVIGAELLSREIPNPDAIAVIGFARVHEVLDLNHFFTRLRAAIVPGARDSVE